MTAIWPNGVIRVPDEPWVLSPLDELAVGYDALDGHGWYRNLDPLVATAAPLLHPGAWIVDYSGGTGILTRRLLAAVGDLPLRLVVVDASAKFLRMALERLGDDDRVGYRLLAWLEEPRRLQTLEEVLAEGCATGIDLILCANAVHLYPDLDVVFSSWRGCITAGGRALIQSGNIAGDGITIDDTVRRAEQQARSLVARDERFAPFRPDLEDQARLRAYDELRDRYFLPTRPVASYIDALEAAGFSVASVDRHPVAVDLVEWTAFLRVYHEGIIGWAGGTERIDGRAPSEESIALRQELLAEALRAVYPGESGFEAMWTHLDARPE